MVLSELEMFLLLTYVLGIVFLSYLIILKPITRERIKMEENEAKIGYSICAIMFIIGMYITIFSIFTIMWLPPIIFAYGIHISRPLEEES